MGKNEDQQAKSKYATQFALLGLKQSDSPSPAQVYSAYRRKSLGVHPDHNKTPEAEVKFQELTNACDQLIAFIEGVDETKNQPLALLTYPPQYFEYFLSLPQDVIIQVLKKLELKDVLLISHLNKYLRELIQAAEYLPQLMRDVKLPIKNPIKLTMSSLEFVFLLELLNRACGYLEQCYKRNRLSMWNDGTDNQKKALCKVLRLALSSDAIEWLLNENLKLDMKKFYIGLVVRLKIENARFNHGSNTSYRVLERLQDKLVMRFLSGKTAFTSEEALNYFNTNIVCLDFVANEEELKIFKDLAKASSTQPAPRRRSMGGMF